MEPSSVPPPQPDQKLPGRSEAAWSEAREVAAEDGVSINQLISSALGEKIAAIKTQEYLHQCGEGAKAEDLAAVLALVPDEEPEADDRFPVPPAL